MVSYGRYLKQKLEINEEYVMRDSYVLDYLIVELKVVSVKTFLFINIPCYTVQGKVEIIEYSEPSYPLIKVYYYYYRNSNINP